MDRVLGGHPPSPWRSNRRRSDAGHVRRRSVISGLPGSLVRRSAFVLGHQLGVCVWPVGGQRYRGGSHAASTCAVYFRTSRAGKPCRCRRRAGHGFKASRQRKVTTTKSRVFFRKEGTAVSVSVGASPVFSGRALYPSAFGVILPDRWRLRGGVKKQDHVRAGDIIMRRSGPKKKNTLAPAPSTTDAFLREVLAPAGAVAARRRSRPAAVRHGCATAAASDPGLAPGDPGRGCSWWPTRWAASTCGSPSIAALTNSR